MEDKKNGGTDMIPDKNSENKMNDPKVKQAIRTLRAKGVSIKQIEREYRYYDGLGKKKNESHFLESIL